MSVVPRGSRMVTLQNIGVVISRAFAFEDFCEPWGAATG